MKSDFPEEGDEDKRIGRRSERCAAMSRRVDIAEGVAIMLEGEGGVGDDLSISIPEMLVIQGLQYELVLVNNNS